jgi:anti-anti-sigma regulatory factor
MQASFMSLTEPQALPGTVCTIIRDHLAVVRLQGDIDLAMAGELARVTAGLPSRVTDVVVDTSSMTFADGTLVAFVAALVEHHQVTLRAPTRIVRQLFAVSGVRDLPTSEV